MNKGARICHAAGGNANNVVMTRLDRAIQPPRVRAATKTSSVRAQYSIFLLLPPLWVEGRSATAELSQARAPCARCAAAQCGLKGGVRQSNAHYCPRAGNSPLQPQGNSAPCVSTY